ncbi:MAG: NACHT and WD repeat domain-containing protein [Phormidesmis sp.]
MPNPSSSPDFAPQATTTQIDQMVKGDYAQTIGQVLGGMVIYVSGGQAIINAAPEAESDASKTPELGSNPYKGLLAFQEMDGDRFFGRDVQIKQLWQNFCDLPAAESGVRLLPIYGPSGSGKSSLARAGLIPELARRPVPGKDKAKVAVLVPGIRPVAALATVLARIAMNDPSPTEKIEEFEKRLLRANENGQIEDRYDGLRRIADALPGIENSPLIVLVDQLEEIYTLCKDAEKRTAFVQNLLCAASDRSNRVSVIVTMRSDFLGETQKYPALNRLFSTQGFLAPVMNTAELRKAINKPAELAGHSLDENTIDRLIHETKDREGALPLLQFALKQIWKGIEKGVPPAATLEELDGVGGALAETAERVYAALQPVQQGIARRIFSGLVELGEGTRRDTRRRVAFEKLVTSKDDPAEVQRVLDKFTDPANRLITCSATEDGIETAEVTHEALFEHWKQLQDWLNESRSALHFQRRLEVAAAEWEKMRRPEGKLWRSPDLDLLRQYYKTSSDGMSSLEVDFFNDSVDAVEQARKEKKRQRRRLLAVLSTGLALTTGAAIFSTYQIQQVERQRVEQLATTSEAFLLSGQPLEAKINAIAAIGASKSMFVQFLRPLSSRSAYASLLNSRNANVEKNQLDHKGEIHSVAFSPDGKTLVSGGSDDNPLRLWDSKTGASIGELATSHRLGVNSVAFSPNGKILVSGSRDGTLQIWDVPTGEPMGELLNNPTGIIQSVAFSPDNKTFVSGGQGGVLRLWDAKTGMSINKPLKASESSISSVAFSPDGKTLVSGSSDGTLRLWNAETGASIGEPLDGYEDYVLVNSVAFSPDGKTLVSGGSDGTLQLWNAETGNTIGESLKGHGDAVNSVTFSPDGKMLASGSEDLTLRLWNVTTGEPIGEPLKGPKSGVSSVAFSPDGKTLASGSFDSTLRLWDMIPNDEWTIGDETSVRSFAFSPDGKTIATGSFDGALWLWDAATGDSIGGPMKGHESSVDSVSFSPDNKTIVSGSDDGRLQRWNAMTGDPIGGSMQGHERSINSVVFSPDGKTIASGSDDGTLRLWDTATGASIGELFIDYYEGAVRSIAFSPDGKNIVSAGVYDSLLLWDAATGAFIEKLFMDFGETANSVAFSPDGKIIISAHNNNLLRRWDGITGEPVGGLFVDRVKQVNLVHSVAFSPDGEMLVSGSDALQLWDTTTGDPIGEPWVGHDESFYSVVFSPDGAHLASVGSDRALRLWKNISQEKLLQSTCNQLIWHPTLAKPESEVEKEAKRTCDRYVWSTEKTSS